MSMETFRGVQSLFVSGRQSKQLDRLESPSQIQDSRHIQRLSCWVRRNRAELGTEEVLSASTVLEGLVILKDNPDYEAEDDK